MRYCHRRIDQALKRVQLNNTNSVEEITSNYLAEVSNFNIKNIADEMRSKMKQYIQDKDIPSLLRVYDHKGLLELVARNMRGNKVSDFKDWIVRILGDKKAPAISNSIALLLPEIKAN